MNPRHLEKQLLLTETEVRRRQLAADWSTTKTRLELSMRQSIKLGACVLVAAAGLTVFNLIRGPTRPTKRRLGRGRQVLLRGIELAVAIWATWRALHDRAEVQHHRQPLRP